jgi:UDP-perosamine 4-acetyltransferase
MTAQSILLLGCGGHAHVVLEILRICGRTATGCLDIAPPGKRWPEELAYLGTDDHLANLNPNEWVLINCLGSTQNTTPRTKIFQRATALGFEFTALTHPSAVVAPDLAIGQGGQLHAGVVVQPGVSLGENVLINTGAILDHGTKIADHVHIAPGVVISGNVTIGLAAHIGTGAVLKQGVEIGASAIIGSGAVVINDVPPGACFIGNPARAISSIQQGPTT